MESSIAAMATGMAMSNLHNSVSISMNITVTFGHSVVEVAAAAQKAVSASVENRTGVKVSEVNVNICGIAK